jgi:hypothetical protein
MVNVRFVELAPPRSIVEAVNFVTTDPAFFGEMTLTAAFEEVPGGTEVTLVFKNLPPGLRAGTTRRAREPGAAGAASNENPREVWGSKPSRTARAANYVQLQIQHSAATGAAIACFVFPGSPLRLLPPSSTIRSGGPSPEPD